jgi:hypothetical protein
VDWIFATYRGIELEEIYLTTPNHLESFFSKWENKWHTSGGRDINNPKIPLSWVKQKGKKIYPSDE